MATQTDPTPAAELHAVLEKFFETKTACDVEGTMAYFAPDLASYIDATLGWDFDSHSELKAVFEQYMPGWAPPARSYASKILAGEDSALVHMVDTPELFGGELRILAAVDFRAGKLVRWDGYWDGSAYDAGAVRPIPHTGRDSSQRSEGHAGRGPGRSRADQSRDSTAAGIRRGGGFEWTARPDADRLVDHRTGARCRRSDHGDHVGVRLQANRPGEQALPHRGIDPVDAVGPGSRM